MNVLDLSNDKIEKIYLGKDLICGEGYQKGDILNIKDLSEINRYDVKTNYNKFNGKFYKSSEGSFYAYKNGDFYILNNKNNEFEKISKNIFAHSTSNSLYVTNLKSVHLFVSSYEVYLLDKSNDEWEKFDDSIFNENFKNTYNIFFLENDKILVDRNGILTVCEFIKKDNDWSIKSYNIKGVSENRISYGSIISLAYENEILSFTESRKNSNYYETRKILNLSSGTISSENKDIFSPNDISTNETCFKVDESEFAYRSKKGTFKIFKDGKLVNEVVLPPDFRVISGNIYISKVMEDNYLITSGGGGYKGTSFIWNIKTNEVFKVSVDGGVTFHKPHFLYNHYYKEILTADINKELLGYILIKNKIE